MSVSNWLARRGFECGSEIPGQQILDVADRMIGESREHGAQVEFVVEPVELRRPDQAVHPLLRWSQRHEREQPPRRQFFASISYQLWLHGLHGDELVSNNRAKIALAWLPAKKPWIVPGTTKLARLEENLGAANVRVTTDDVRFLEEASSKIKLQGARSEVP